MQTMKHVVFMFSGQGSQYYQMGLDFYSENESFNKHLNSLNDIIKNRFDFSLIDIMYDQTKSIATPFSDPILSSLAIYLIEHALASTLLEQGIKPNQIIGSSMGIFVASTFANCLDTYQGLDAIYQLMRQIKENCVEGCMLAVLSNPEFYYNSKLLNQYCELAAIDRGFSFVLSMQSTDVKYVEMHLEEAGILFQRLPVSRAYHSYRMDTIKEIFLDIHLSTIEPKIPLICCTKTEKLSDLHITDLWDSVRKPLLFSDTIAKIEKDTTCHYIDVGPSGMMSTYLKYILPKSSTSKIYPILSPYKNSVKNFRQVLMDCV